MQLPSSICSPVQTGQPHKGKAGVTVARQQNWKVCCLKIALQGMVGLRRVQKNNALQMLVVWGPYQADVWLCCCYSLAQFRQKDVWSPWAPWKAKMLLDIALLKTSQRTCGIFKTIFRFSVVWQKAFCRSWPTKSHGQSNIAELTLGCAINQM